MYIWIDILILASVAFALDQVVWGDSEELGCGFQMCDEIHDPETGGTARNAMYFVCNYWPA